jgi:hypothetical protein
MLEFWLGTWCVCRHDGTEVGRNVIEPAVGGAAVLEHWRSSGGDEGESLFYLDHESAVWRQVWVQAGAVKRKAHDPEWTDGVRFAGTAFLPGRQIADRTTLTPLADGGVRQLIEQSRDGVEWLVAFDALYERV